MSYIRRFAISLQSVFPKVCIYSVIGGGRGEAKWLQERDFSLVSVERVAAIRDPGSELREGESRRVRARIRDGMENETKLNSPETPIGPLRNVESAPVEDLFCGHFTSQPCSTLWPG